MKIKLLCRMMISVFLAALLLTSFPAFAASGSCISEIKLASGKNAIDELEKSGYTVIYQNLNYTPDAKEKIYMGYKTGNEAVTDLIVSSEKSSSVVVGPVTYTLLSEKNLNAGTSGAPLYLYYTRDKKAGDGISALITFSRDPKNRAAVPEFYGDGSVPVRTKEGKAADFDAGIDEYELYFFMIRKRLCLPYISELKTVDVSNGDDFFERITSTGCDYFIADPVCSSGNCDTYLCYNRTADVSKSVRYVLMSDTASLKGIGLTSAGRFESGGKTGELYYTGSDKIGNPITDITAGAVMSENFTLGDWAKSYFGGRTTAAASRIFNETEYGKLIQSKEKYTQIPVKVFEGEKEISDTGLYIVLSKTGLSFDSGSVPKGGIIETESGYDADGSVRDTEDTTISKNDDGTEAPEDVPGSAIGEGSLMVIAAILITAVILTFVFVMISNRNRKEDNEVR